MLVAIAGESEPFLMRYELAGDILTLRPDQARYDFDDDGTDEPALAVYTFERQPTSGGMSVVQMAGAWKSTALTLSLEGNPAVTVDLGSRGGFFALKLNPAGMATIVRAWPARNARVQWGTIALQGDSLKASLEGPDIAFGFQYSGGALTLSQRGVGWDFSGDGNDQPAVLTVTLNKTAEIDPGDLVNPWSGGDYTFTSQEYSAYTAMVSGPINRLGLQLEADGSYEWVAIVEGDASRHHRGTYRVVANLLVLIRENDGQAQAFRYAFDGQGLDLEGNNATFYFSQDSRVHRAKMQIRMGIYTWTVPEMAGTYQSEFIKVNRQDPFAVFDVSDTDAATLTLAADGTYALVWTRGESTLLNAGGLLRNVVGTMILTGLNPTGAPAYATYGYMPVETYPAPSFNLHLTLIEQMYDFSGSGPEEQAWIEFGFAQTSGGGL